VTLAAIPSRYVAFQAITKAQSPELTQAGFLPETLWLDPEGRGPWRLTLSKRPR